MMLKYKLSKIFIVALVLGQGQVRTDSTFNLTSMSPQAVATTINQNGLRAWLTMFVSTI